MLAVAGCARQNADADLLQAETYLSQGDWEQARACCISITEHQKENLTPSQLCRQAMVYVRLADVCDNPDDMAAAADCFDQAYQLSPDSVADFASTLNYEQSALLRLLRDVNMAKSLPAPSEFEEYPDSLYSASSPDSID